MIDLPAGEVRVVLRSCEVGHNGGNESTVVSMYCRRGDVAGDRRDMAVWEKFRGRARVGVVIGPCDVPRTFTRREIQLGVGPVVTVVAIFGVFVLTPRRPHCSRIVQYSTSCSVL